MAKKRKQVPYQPRPWVPLQQVTPNPAMLALRRQIGSPDPHSVWANDEYQVIRTDYDSGLSHLSIKRNSRHTIRDWRHLQAIKNECCGPEREGVELFPAESRLVDSANEYHLWVLPEGDLISFGFAEGLVSSDQQIDLFNDQRKSGVHKGRQRHFQPGLPVAVDRNEQPGADEDMAAVLTAPQKVRA